MNVVEWLEWMYSEEHNKNQKGVYHSESVKMWLDMETGCIVFLKCKVKVYDNPILWKLPSLVQSQSLSLCSSVEVKRVKGNTLITVGKGIITSAYRNTMFYRAISHYISKLNIPSPQKKKKTKKKKTISVENEHRKRKCLHFYKFLNVTTKPTLEISATIQISTWLPQE